MFVDSSVIVAILAQEDDASDFADILAQSDRLVTSPVVILEATMRLSTLLGLPPNEIAMSIDQLINELSMDVVPITQEMGKIAIIAFDKFGKGRHPARLNFGDCLSYAVAKNIGVPLLFKGNDFSLTDIERAF
jgi:ribonuclease VapC